MRAWSRAGRPFAGRTADGRSDPAAIPEDGLREAGHLQVVRIDDMSHLLQRIYTIDPDVILIDLENPSRDVLEQNVRRRGLVTSRCAAPGT